MVVLDFLAIDNFDFTRNIVKKIRGEKLVKCWVFFVIIEFLDKKFDFSNSEGCISMHEIAFETKVFCRNIKREIARSTCGWVRRGNMASLKKIPNGLRL